MCTMYMIYIAYCIVLQLVYMVHAANYIVQYSGPLCKVQHTLHIRKARKRIVSSLYCKDCALVPSAPFNLRNS